MGKITLFFRKRLPHFHSIEGVFNSLLRYFQEVVPTTTVFQKVECPYYRLTPLTLFKNYWFVHRHKGLINHITGDVHYLSIILNKRTTILTIHDCVPLYITAKKNPKYWILWLIWYKIPTLCAGTITTISEKTKADLITLVGVPPTKIRVIPNPYDPFFDSEAIFVNSSVKPRILQIGTNKNKNLDRIIEAIEGISCSLDIIGNLSAQYKSILEEKNIDYTVSFGITKEELREKYHACSLVLFVSTYEGFGMPIIEAQAMGKPLITSNISPMKEVAGEGACLINPYSIFEIRTHVLRFLSDQAYCQTIIDAGKKNVQHYSIKIIAAQYLALYDEIRKQLLLK